LPLPTEEDDDPEPDYVLGLSRRIDVEGDGGVLRGLRLRWDPHINSVSLYSLPQHHLAYLSNEDSSRSIVLKMSALGLSVPTGQVVLTQSWFYEVYLCFSGLEMVPLPPLNTVPQDFPRLKIYIPPPERGLRCNLNYPRAGMEHGVAWIVTDHDDMGSILLLQIFQSTSGPTINSVIEPDRHVESADIDESSKDNQVQSGIVAWPCVYSPGAGLDMVHLRAGLACGPNSRRGEEWMNLGLEILCLDKIK
jgi:hypothetical protein